MRARFCFAVAVGLVVMVMAGNRAQPDGPPEVKGVLEKAIKAHGGADALGKFKAATFKLKGKFYGMGEGIDYTGTWNIQIPGKQRVEIEGEANGVKFTFIQVFDGKKGWVKIGAMLKEMDKEELAEYKEEVYAGLVNTLVPLRGKEYQLSSLGAEAKVGDRAAVGLRVSCKGHRDINLYFDKDKGLLLKTERTVKDIMGGGQEVTQETVMEKYKDIQGVQHPMKVTIRRQGKLFVEGEVTEFQQQDKLDAGVFAKP